MVVPVIIKNTLGLARWEWPLAGTKPLINIRSETAAEKPSFARSFHAGRHVLVPVSGFYEWDASGQPYYVSSLTHAVFALRGLWTRGHDDRPCFAILTENADTGLSRIHPRKPQMTAVDGSIITDAQPVAVGHGVNDIGRNDPSLLLASTQAVQSHLF